MKKRYRKNVTGCIICGNVLKDKKQAICPDCKATEKALGIELSQLKSAVISATREHTYQRKKRQKAKKHFFNIKEGDLK